MLNVSTLRPGYLVSLKTTVTGNVSYDKRDIEAQHVDSDGALRATWQTEKTVVDPAEHERATKARGRARSLVTSVCSASTFGLLCPASRKDELDAAISEARGIAEEFNAGARLSNVRIYVVAGKVSENDVEAVRAINSEVRELMDTMESGLQRLDVEAVREAANKARGLGQMLSADASSRIKSAIDTARSLARKVVKAGEIASDELAAAKLTLQQSRAAFLDLDEGEEIRAPESIGRALDLEPVSLPMAAAQIGAVRQMDL